MRKITRRSFLKKSIAAAVTAPVLSEKLLAKAGSPDIFVVHGKDIKKMIKAGIAHLGGWKTFIQKGEKVTIKPNAAWASTPEQGGNTNPLLVGQCVAQCLSAGASEVIVPENSCSNPKIAFTMSGIKDAVEKAGGRMYAARENKYFRKVDLSGAKNLKNAEVVKDVLETGCLINIPVAKHHNGAILTLSMKNWMGSVKDRKAWHKNNLHQCIADFSMFIKPNLIIIDATRIMLTKGPRGPGELVYTNQLIFGRDPVAVDAYATILFKRNPFDIPYIKIAHNMKVGCGDLSKINVVHIEA